MIKLLGFLLGSVVSVVSMLVILGMPDIKLSEAVVGIDDEQLTAVRKIVAAAKDESGAVADEVVEELTEHAGKLSGPPESEGPMDELVPPGDVPIEERAPAVNEAVAGAADNTQAPSGATTGDSVLFDSIPPESGTDAADNESGLRWHAFWNPFRSEIAANGFVGQLEKVTGLDYRVVKIKTGVYEVTFAYENDEERRDKLSLIASATGLELPEF